MELWQAGLSTLVGGVIMLVTQLLKRWPQFNLAIVRYIAVIVLTIGGGFFLGWFYGIIGTEITSQEIVIQSFVAGMAALGINITRKTVKQIKEKT